MEIILLLIAGGVIYFLYTTLQEYLKNPLHTPQEVLKQKIELNTREQEINTIDMLEARKKNKVKNSEYGVLSAILGVMARADGKACEFENALANDLIDEMAHDNAKVKKSELLEIYNDESNSDVEALCTAFNDLTKGEYKKRLKVVEFLFVMAYADGEFSKKEEELLIDIAAYFELTNDDFNHLYDEFAKIYESALDIDKVQALEILKLDENFKPDELETAYKNAIKNAKGAILDNKNVGKSMLENNTALALRKIEKAYEILQSKYS